MHILIINYAICLSGYPQSTTNCALWVLFVAPVQLYSVGTIVHSTHRVQFLYCHVTAYPGRYLPVLWTQSVTIVPGCTRIPGTIVCIQLYA